MTTSVEKVEPWGTLDDYCGDGQCGVSQPDDTRVVLLYTIAVPQDFDGPFTPNHCPGELHVENGNDEDAVIGVSGKYARQLDEAIQPGRTKYGVEEYSIAKASTNQSFYIDSTCGVVEPQVNYADVMNLSPEDLAKIMEESQNAPPKETARFAGVIAANPSSSAPAASPAVTGTPTATPTAVAETAEDYMVGDTGPGGGIVFYDAGSVQPWGRYLEAGPELAEENWCDDWKLDVAGTKTAIGAGAANTKLTAAACGAGAVNTVSDYDVGGKTDWFLPSKDELNALSEQRDSVGGFANDYYWSSSQVGASDAWVQNLLYGHQVSASRNGTLRVRPVRAF